MIETKTILLSLTYRVGIGELILAIYFWVTHSKNEIRKVMALLAGSISLWALFNAGLGLTDALESRLVYAMGPLILTALFHVAILYPIPSFRIDTLHLYLLYVPILISALAILFTNSIFESSYITESGASVTIGGPLFVIFNLYVLILYISALFFIFSRVPKQNRLLSNNAVLFGLAILIGGLPGIILGVVHSFQQLPFNYLYGPIFSGIWLAATTYIIRRS